MVAINKSVLFSSLLFVAEYFTVSYILLRFSSDTEAELELVRVLSLAAGAKAAVVANHWAEGGAGAVALGAAVVEACAAARADSALQFRCVFTAGSCA